MGVGERGVCTLLGPEGPEPIVWSGLNPLGPFLVHRLVRRWGYRPYFENYTVDASIFELIFDRFRKMILKIISQFLTIRTHVVSSL